MREIKRRQFLGKMSAGAAAATSGLLLGCNTGKQMEAPAVQTKKSFEWRMVTTWPPHFPILGEGADLIARWIQQMSGGRLHIQVYGGGELVPALEAFDAVSMGTAEMGHGAAYYWAGKSQALQFFTTVPFGMNAQQMNAWLYSGGGLELWREAYAPFDLVPFPIGNTGVQMGGWFNKQINTIADVKGLKMRIPGLGGKVLAKAGGAAILSAGGEIYTNLERGVIDATEWVGPYHDYLMGFHKIAKYYYYPGWHEPGSVLEMFINQGAYQKLPDDLKQIIDAAAAKSNGWILSEFESKNRTYLQKLIKEEHVQIVKFPEDVLKAFKTYSAEVIDDMVSKDPLSKKVYDSYNTFRQETVKWAELSERVYYTDLGA